MSNRNSWLRLFTVATLLIVCGQKAAGQITSDFQPPGGTGNWQTGTNWSNGIPSAPGDVARLPGTASAANLTAPVTIGQLILLSSLSNASVTGSSTLTFDNPGSALALIDSSRPTATIAVPIAIAAGEQLRIHSNSQINLNGGINSSAGDIVSDGPGTLAIAGASPGWNGVFTVSAGTLTVSNATALGTAAGGTQLNAGVIQPSVALSEPMTLVGGTLQSTGTVLDFNGQLTIPSGSTSIIRGPLRILGGAVGDGDVHILADTTTATTVGTLPLAQAGGLSIASAVSQQRFVDLLADNTYGGLTTINNVRVQVMTAGGLGSSAVGTQVTAGGELRLAYTSSEDVSIDNSTMYLWQGNTAAADNPYNGQLTLRTGTLRTNPSGSTPKFSVVKPIILDGGLNTIAPRGALTLNGVTGHGDLLITPNSDVFAAGKIQHDGTFEVRGGAMHLSAPDVFTGSVLVRNTGRLIADANQHIDRVSSGTKSDSCCSIFAAVEATPGNFMQVNQLEILEGRVKGDIRTPGPIDFFGQTANRTVSNLTSGVGVALHAGQFKLDDSDTTLGPTTGPLSIESLADAGITLSPSSRPIAADFHLNNASGYADGGALRLISDGQGSTTTLTGDIYLGDQGATIGGGTRWRLTGQIYGGDFIVGKFKDDDPVFYLSSRTPAYTGKTTLRSGEIALSENGRLANTSRIQISTRSRLAVDFSPTDGPLSDRIADGIPIDMYGGELSVWPTDFGMNERERVGQVNVKRGVAVIGGTHFSVNSQRSDADLVIGQLNREPGSVVSIATANSRTSTPFSHDNTPSRRDFILENQIPLVNGMLPAWLTEDSGFTTYDGTGRIVGYQGPFTSFAASDATSVVRPPSSASTLDQDRTIHALYAFGNVGPVDLGGHTLTVGSGGVSGATLSNGTIRAGANANGELIFIGPTNISANIADNGPTSVIYTAEGSISGINTYTGKTYVENGIGKQMLVDKGTALPTGGDVEVTGWGTLYLRDSAGFHYNLGTIGIRDGGTLLSTASSNFVKATKVELEAGSFGGTLDGNTPVVKTTDGVALLSVSEANPGFIGTVDVNAGLLIAGGGFSANYGYLALGQGGVSVHTGGRLALQPANNGLEAGMTPLTITLDGGTLYGGSTVQDFQRSLTGTVDVVKDSQLMLTDGSATQFTASNFVVKGRIHVASGKTLEIVNPVSSLSNRLFVSDGVFLDSGAKLAGQGGLQGNLTVAAGGIISPGSELSQQPIGSLNVVTSSSTFTSASKFAWGKSGQYDWDITDATGDAGNQFDRGWDIITVQGQLTIEATADSPFVIDLRGRTPDGSFGSVAHLGTGPYHWLIAQATSVVGFDAAKFRIDASQFGGGQPALQGAATGTEFSASAFNFWLTLDSGSIYLNAQFVPEPTSFLLLLTFCIALGGSRIRILRK